MGRKPKPKEEAKDVRITIRLTQEQHEVLKQEATARRMTTAAYCRHLLANREITFVNQVVLDVEDLRKATAQLGRIGGLLNQIAYWYNTHGRVTDEVKVDTVRTLEKIRAAANKLTETASESLKGG